MAVGNRSGWSKPNVWLPYRRGVLPDPAMQVAQVRLALSTSAGADRVCRATLATRPPGGLTVAKGVRMAAVGRMAAIAVRRTRVCFGSLTVPRSQATADLRVDGRFAANSGQSPVQRQRQVHPGLRSLRLPSVISYRAAPTDGPYVV